MPRYTGVVEVKYTHKTRFEVQVAKKRRSFTTTHTMYGFFPWVMNRYNEIVPGHNWVKRIVRFDGSRKTVVMRQAWP
jgi:hypothetical protein